MKLLLNIAFGVATLWTLISITAGEQSDPIQFDYHFPANTSDLKPQINETTSSRNEASSTSVLSVSTSVTSSSAALASGTNSLSQSSSVSPVALDADEIQKLGRILEQDTSISSSPKAPEVTERATTSTARGRPTENSDTNINSTESVSTNGTSNSTTTSVPKVVLPTKETKTYIAAFFQKSLSWLGDQYTLSIVGPILGGFLFAMVIIVTITTFACIRRRCRRRRFRKKILPETIRKMGPSDRARLLAETSDEEF